MIRRDFGESVAARFAFPDKALRLYFAADFRQSPVRAGAQYSEGEVS